MPEQDNKGRTTVPVDVQEYAELVQAKQRLTELKAVEAQIEEYSETIKTQKADIAKLEGQVKEYSEKIEGMEKAQTKTKIDSTLERMKKAGKLQPAKESEVREFAETLDDSEIREYAEGVKATQLDRYLGQLEAKAEGSVINFSEKSTKGPDKKPAVDAEDDSEFAARVQEYAEKNGCSFEDAIDKVATPEDEDAHQARIR
jgi:chromosome segregation ATPase